MGYQYSGLIKHYASDNTFRSFKVGLLFVLYLFIRLRVYTMYLAYLQCLNTLQSIYIIKDVGLFCYVFIS